MDVYYVDLILVCKKNGLLLTMTIMIKYCSSYDTIIMTDINSHFSPLCPPAIHVWPSCKPKTISLNNSNWKHFFEIYTSNYLVRTNWSESNKTSPWYRKFTFCSLNVCSPPPPSHQSSSGNCPPIPTLSQVYHLGYEQMGFYPPIKWEPLR